MLKRFRLPILAGILIGTSYIPFPPWAIFFAFVPLWLWWNEQSSLKQVFWGGWWTQFTLTLIGFNWVTLTLYQFGSLPLPVAVLGFLIYCSFANLHVPLAGVLWWYLKRYCPSAWGRWGVMIASTALLESLYPMIFDWNLGYTWLASKWPAYHMAEWIGIQGLSTLTILLNGLLLWFWLNRKQPRGRLVPLGILAFCLLLFTGLGVWLKDRLPTPDKMARVLIVQANIGNMEKMANEHNDQFRDVIIDRYTQLTLEGLQGGQTVDFAVWPETAFPHFLNEPYFYSQYYAQRLRRFVQENRLTLVTGAYGWIDKSEQMLNAMYGVTNLGALSDKPYAKTRLLAFGEYVPGAHWFPGLKKLLPQVADFARGNGAQIIQLTGFRLAPLICYEGLFADMAREAAHLNPDFFVNLTNDSWYGTWQQPYQHLRMTLGRAIEFRRPMIRSTNTGISTILLADGTQLAQSPLHRPWQHLYEVPYKENAPSTFYAGAGYYFSWVILLLMLATCLWGRHEPNKKH